MLTLWLVACGDLECGPGTHEEDGLCVADEETETDTDTDTDADTDSDTDADTDTDVVEHSAAPVPTADTAAPEGCEGGPVFGGPGNDLVEILVADLDQEVARLSGDGGVICSVSCEVPWVTTYIGRNERLPYTLRDSDVIWYVRMSEDAGREIVRCTLETSDGLNPVQVVHLQRRF